MQKIKIGILYICTGKYSVFWDDFYESSKNFFVTNQDVEKHYFVFTDSEEIKGDSRVHIYYKKSEGFPSDSLGRFDMFLSIEHDLDNMDFVFFFNANMLFIDYVGKEVLPINFVSGLTGTLHPGYYNLSKEKLPYERNPKSKAYIPYIKGAKYRYYMGGLNGGRTREFMSLCRACSLNIAEDTKNALIASFHDESHINAYFFQKDVLVLPPSYGFPEGLEPPFEVKILIRDKTKYYEDYFVKEYANPFLLPSPFKRTNFLRKSWSYLTDHIRKKLSK